jgi:hypothetical protein
MQTISRFLNAIFWEFVQNLPVIVMFVMAVWYWAQGRRKEALICVTVSAISGALVIRFTEPLISGYEESMTTTLVNMVTFGLLQALFVAYIASDIKWSNWKMDLILSGTAGVGLAIAQGVSSPGASLIGVVLHSLALGVMSALVIIAIRKSKQQTRVDALKNALLITTLMTLIISVIDYGYFLIFESL